MAQWLHRQRDPGFKLRSSIPPKGRVPKLPTYPQDAISVPRYRRPLQEVAQLQGSVSQPLLPKQ